MHLHDFGCGYYGWGGQCERLWQLALLRVTAGPGSHPINPLYRVVKGNLKVLKDRMHTFRQPITNPGINPTSRGERGHSQLVTTTT